MVDTDHLIRFVPAFSPCPRECRKPVPKLLASIANAQWDAMTLAAKHFIRDELADIEGLHRENSIGARIQ